MKCHIDNIFVTGNTESCQNDEFPVQPVKQI